VFIDEATITVKAGNGGNGCVAFRREKYVPRGGPSGGDGGRGGDVVLRSSKSHNTLIQFRYRPEHKAEKGRFGEGSNRAGRDGEPLVLEVPPGTVVYEAESGEKLFDFVAPDQEFIAAHGGRGGRGNARFATSTKQAPRYAQPGSPGEERRLRLELKLLADVGLVGFPNAGKSTLISRLSAAHPKIADYPFTTLEPSLGVVATDEFQSFLMADIPGLIEGAHEGRGLGTQFLRHIERTRLLVHLIDVSEVTGRDPVSDYGVIVGELESFSKDLAKKPMVVAATKIDAAQDPQRVEGLRQFCLREHLPFFTISAVTGAGLDELKYALGARVRELAESAVAAS
jgi:GTP-binding protein